MAMKDLSKSSDPVELTEALVLARTRAQDLESVKKLNCWASNIGDVTVVRHMPNLEVCSLSINKLSTLRDFAHCYKLKELYVRTNNIQNLSDIHYLKNLRRLRSLWLSENPCATDDGYRKTVLKTLPYLNKLDNVVVTEDEVAEAEMEGEDVPVPEDFSYSSVFDDLTSFADNDRLGRRSVSSVSSVSESSDTWALPRRKRLQRKREEIEKERLSCEEGSGSAKSGDDGGGGSSRGNAGDDNRRSHKSSTSKDSPRSDETGDDDEENEDDDDKDNGTEKKDDEKITPGAEPKQKWAEKVESKAVFNEDGNSNNNDGNENEDEEGEDGEDNDGNVSGRATERDKDGDRDKKSLPVQTVSKLNLSFPVPEKLQKLHVISVNNVDDDGDKCDQSLDTTNNDSTLRSDSLDCNNSNVQVTSSATVITTDSNSDGKDSNSISSIISAFNANANQKPENPTVNKEYSKETDTKSESSLLDRIRLDDSLDVKDSTEDKQYSNDNFDSIDIGDLSLEVEETDLPQGVPIAKPVAAGVMNLEQASEKAAAVDWEEYNRLRVQLGVKPVDKLPNTAKSVNSEALKAKNSNILQAVLCLVKDLDKDSLDIVANTVKARLDKMKE